MNKIVHTEWSDGPMPRVKYFITQEEDGTRWMCKVNRSGVGREEEEATPGDRVYDVTSYGDNWWGILSDYNDRILNLHHAGNKSIPVERTPLISFRRLVTLRCLGKREVIDLCSDQKDHGR